MRKYTGSCVYRVCVLYHVCLVSMTYVNIMYVCMYVDVCVIMYCICAHTVCEWM